MAAKKEKKLRRRWRKAINSTATQDLRKEIFRLAKNRDILGILLIAASLLIAVLSIQLYKHW